MNKERYELLGVKVTEAEHDAIMTMLFDVISNKRWTALSNEDKKKIILNLRNKIRGTKRNEKR